jgi:acetyl esterase/lipase
MKFNAALLFFLAAARACAVVGDRSSFGPLSPSAVPCEREYIWPEGKMPDAQPQQIAAKTGETKQPGYKTEDFRRPYIDWYAPNPECKTDLCVITVSGGGFGCCCDAARLRPAVDRFVKAGVTVADLTYRTPRPKGLPIHQSAWEDLQRAVRVVRSQAAKRGFAPAKIGATGISAGAKAVLLVATSSLTSAYKPVDEIDSLPCNLLFAIPQAPAYVLTDGDGCPNSRDGDAPDVSIVPELTFDAQTCPMCLFQGGIDVYSPFGSTQIYRRLRRMNIPAELHIFADRWHGFHGDMNRTDDATAWDHWFHRAEEFIRQMNFDGRLGPEVLLMSRFTDDSARGAYEKESLWPAGKIPHGGTKQCEPFLEWHFPKELKTKAVQIIFSGGGYHWNKPEGMEVTPARRYLNAKGMTVVTLKYRSPRPEGGLAKHTSAWQDLQRAVRVVRAKAAKKGLDPARIGIMGGSAGGHLALMGATSSRHKSYLPVDDVDKLPCNAQWAVAIYPAYSLTDGVDCKNTHGGNDDGDRLVPEFSFDLDTCPVLFIHGDADGYSSMASVKAWEQLRRMGVQGEIHTLAKRGHCFQNKASPGTGSYTYLDRIWEFLNHKQLTANN